MATKIFRPRRGTSSGLGTSTVLAKGEMFFEDLNSAGIGKGPMGIKLGDGSTAYSSLPYALGPGATVTFTASTTTSDSTLLTEIVSGKSYASLFGSIKTLLSNLVSEVTTLNNEIDEHFGLSGPNINMYGCIEMYAGIPFIDLHYNSDDSVDYTGRLCQYEDALELRTTASGGISVLSMLHCNRGAYFNSGVGIDFGDNVYIYSDETSNSLMVRTGTSGNYSYTALAKQPS